MATFSEIIRGSLVTSAIDNMGVIGGLVKGRGAAGDHNAVIAQVWLDIARSNLAPQFLKVESACNLADGPTRDDLSLMELLNAEWVPPQWPEWAVEFWTMAK